MGLSMIHAVLGTAGHIDHGKTALVGALTGIDTDRLDEEKRRGISIDLGFAHLKLTDEIECGFVDVPGHERFVRNMLAGVGGIDIVLLVIAADESIKPQTREHFDICRLLGISHGMVVLTKTDLVDPEILELVKLEVEEFAAGSFLEGAPMIAVSAVTGAGIEELKSAIAAMAKTIAPKDATRHFRLPIDRAFSMKGFGAVVTGTLLSGAIRVEQEVEVHPTGRRARVRGIQVHGRATGKAAAGQRTAVNLSGIEHSELHRGMTLSEPGRFETTRLLDCVVEMLPSAKALKHRAPVHFHAGTAEMEAEVRMAGGSRIEPGARGYARIALRERALLLPGDRFILRMFSPVVTIAGGVVLDPAPPRKLAGSASRLEVLERGTAAARVQLLVRESPYGLSLEALTARTGLSAAELMKAIKEAGVMWVEEQRWALDREWIESRRARIQSALAAFHKQNPLLPGMSREDLRSRELGGPPAFLLDVALKSAPVTAEGDLVRLTSHRLMLKGDEEQALGRIEEAFANAGLTVPGAREVLGNCGVDAARARSLLQILLREKRLVKVADDLLFHPSALDAVRGMLGARRGARFTVPEFKDWTGVSRKYAIPLLEYLDRERVTRREGDARVIL